MTKRDAQAWHWLTHTYLLQDEAGKAKDSLAAAPSSIAQDPYYQVACGELLLAMDKKDSAQTLFLQAVDRTRSKDAAILTAIAEAHIEMKQGDPQFALEMLDRAQKRDKRNAYLNVAAGNAYRKMHKGTEAYQAYKEAIDKNKKMAAAYFNLGRIFRTQKNSELYLEYFQQAIEANNAFAPAYYALYDHYRYIDPVKSMEYFKQYLAYAERSVKDEYAYTDLLYLNKKYDSAIYDAKRIIR